MDEMIIKNCNDVVGLDDTLIVLGDVAMGQIDVSLPKVGRIICKAKMLVGGNHDRIFSGESPARRERFASAYQEVFDDILPEQTSIRLSNNTLVTLCHFPYVGDSHEVDRYAGHRPVDDGTILIHGHTHSHEKVSYSDKGTLMIHVGVDSWNYRPVSEGEIIDLIEANR